MSLGFRSIVAAPGEITWGIEPYGELPDGTPIGIPIIMARGREDGPTVWLCAALHGTEVYGVEVVRRVTREVVDPKLLRGVILSTPAANLLAVRSGEYTGPEDTTDPHTIFPGRAEGSLAMRLSALIGAEGVASADAVIDLHANPIPTLPFCVVTDLNEAPNLVDRSIDLAKASGLTLVLRRPSAAWGAHMAEHALRLGKPALAMHFAGWHRIDAVTVAAGVQAVVNILRHMEMLPGTPEPLQDVRCVPGRWRRDDTADLKAERGGVLHLLKEPGGYVRAGDEVAITRDVFGNVVQRFTAPADALVLGLRGRRNQLVASGDRAVALAFPEVGQTVPHSHVRGGAT
jgi:predicted deacylase